MPCSLIAAVYPADGYASYITHKDNYTHETHNRREVTILLYLNEEWDGARDGGALRVFEPADAGVDDEDFDDAKSDRPSRDIEPRGGRLVIFRSNDVWHRVLPAIGNTDRYAVQLWVEAK